MEYIFFKHVENLYKFKEKPKICFKFLKNYQSLYYTYIIHIFDKVEIRKCSF